MGPGLVPVALCTDWLVKGDLQPYCYVTVDFSVAILLEPKEP